MKGQISMITTKPTTPLETFANDNYLNESRIQNIKEQS